jgi:hypothetical protein
MNWGPFAQLGAVVIRLSLSAGIAYAMLTHQTGLVSAEQHARWIVFGHDGASMSVPTADAARSGGRYILLEVQTISLDQGTSVK